MDGTELGIEDNVWFVGATLGTAGGVLLDGAKLGTEVKV